MSLRREYISELQLLAAMCLVHLYTMSCHACRSRENSRTVRCQQLTIRHITRVCLSVCMSVYLCTRIPQQEGQHPLTGLRAANFRLLANQWADRRLVTQWRHGCRDEGEVCATQVLPMGVGPFAFRYEGKGATPCQHIDTTRKAIDCATTLPLTVFI